MVLYMLFAFGVCCLSLAMLWCPSASECCPPHPPIYSGSLRGDMCENSFIASFCVWELLQEPHAMWCISMPQSCCATLTVCCLFQESLWLKVTG